jgi:hypothetical protein
MKLHYLESNMATTNSLLDQLQRQAPEPSAKSSCQVAEGHTEVEPNGLVRVNILWCRPVCASGKQNVNDDPLT